jgi:hypothetical protein
MIVRPVDKSLIGVLEMKAERLTFGIAVDYGWSSWQWFLKNGCLIKWFGFKLNHVRAKPLGLICIHLDSRKIDIPKFLRWQRLR